jgi:hypothetical protein
LDYIPGAKFLGIVANQFIANNTPEKEELFYSLFLKDKLRFGNAYPLINEKVSFPTPSCWYSDKNKKSENVYQLHFINRATRKKLVSEDIQLKQKREGFINLQKEEITEINQQFHLKSAYDKEKRRSKESQMFGYYSLPSGSVWQFDVDYDADIQLSVIENYLLGKKRIGRSRSAEFGLVEIEKTITSEAIPQNTYASGETLIYSYSNSFFASSISFIFYYSFSNFFLASSASFIFYYSCSNFFLTSSASFIFYYSCSNFFFYSRAALSICYS